MRATDGIDMALDARLPSQGDPGTLPGGESDSNDSDAPALPGGGRVGSGSSAAARNSASTKGRDPRRREKMRRRDSTYWKVLNSALELDFRKGHLKWTMSELSRKSGITRSLIYYHFGRSKTAILNEAVNLIGEEIIATSPERTRLWKEGLWAETVRFSREIAQQIPHLCNFYLLHRERQTEIGESIRKLESIYIRKLQRFFPHLSPAAIRAMFGFFFGVTFAPHVDDQAVEVAVLALKRVVRSAMS